MTFDHMPMCPEVFSLKWRRNELGGVSNQRRLDYLLNRMFRRRQKKTSMLCVTGLCEGNSPGTGDFPLKGPVTRKVFPFQDVIMLYPNQEKPE